MEEHITIKTEALTHSELIAVVIKSASILREYAAKCALDANSYVYKDDAKKARDKCQSIIDLADSLRIHTLALNLTEPNTSNKKDARD